MSLSTFNSKSLLRGSLIALLLLAILYGNDRALQLLPDNEAFIDATRFYEPEKTPSLIFLGSSVMYKNLGSSSRLIDAALTQRLDREVHVRFIVGDGVRSDWLYAILQEMVVPNYVDLPLVWFFWTGLPFEPGVAEESTLLYRNKDANQSSSASNSMSWLELGEFLKTHVALFRVSPVSSASFRQKLQKMFFRLFKPYFSLQGDNSEQVLSNIFRDIDPLRAGNLQVFAGDTINARSGGKNNLREQLRQFENLIDLSLFPEIHQFVQSHYLQMSFFEVTTRSIVAEGVDGRTHFSLGEFSIEDFHAYREKQNRHIQDNGYQLISAINNPRLKREMFATQFYLKEEYYRDFAELVADLLIEQGIIH